MERQEHCCSAVCRVAVRLKVRVVVGLGLGKGRVG